MINDQHMKPITKSFHIILFLGAISCSQPTDPSELVTLQRTMDFMTSYNAFHLNKFDNTVQELGNREEDVRILNTIKHIMGLGGDSPFHTIDNDSVNIESLQLYIDFLLNETQQYEWNQKKDISVLVDLINTQKEIYLTEKKSKNQKLLLINVYLLQTEFLHEYSKKIGYKMIDGGIAQMNNFSDSLEINKVFKAVITLGEPINEELMILEHAQIDLILRDQKITDYTLEYVGKGGWIFAFTPHEAGSYKLGFDVEARYRLYYSGWGYPFPLNKILFVK